MSKQGDPEKLRAYLDKHYKKCLSKGEGSFVPEPGYVIVNSPKEIWPPVEVLVKNPDFAFIASKFFLDTIEEEDDWVKIPLD